jgi:hypothetical protein
MASQTPRTPRNPPTRRAIAPRPTNLEATNSAGDSVHALVAVGSISHDALRNFCSRSTTVTLEDLIAFLNKQTPAVRGAMQYSLLELADAASSEIANLASRFYDYYDRDTAWKNNNPSGRTLTSLSEDFPEFHQLAELGKATRNRKKEAWDGIQTVYPTIASNRSIKSTCTSDKATRSLWAVCRNVRANKNTPGDVIKRLNQALLDRLEGVGQNRNQGVSSKRILLTCDYNKAATYGTLNSVSSTNQDRRAQDLYLVQNSDGIYADPEFAVHSSPPPGVKSPSIVVSSRIAGGVGLRDSPAPSISSLSDFVRNMSVSSTPQPPESRTERLDMMGPTGRHRNTSTCSSGDLKCFAKVPQFIIDYINNLPIQAKTTAERCAILRQISVVGRLGGQNNKKLCWKHTQRLGAALGMMTNSSTWDELLSRIETMMPGKDSEGALEALQTNVRHFNWWRKGCRPAVEGDTLGVYRLFPGRVPFRREVFAGPFRFTEAYAVKIAMAMGMKKELYTTGLRGDYGNVRSNNMMDYLKQSGLLALMRVEFHMYHWHQREQRIEMGWQRNQFGSIAQQVVRQDPGYWLLNVVARTDHLFAITTSPYYVKYATQGQSTGFRHLDQNLRALAAEGKGKDQWQGSLSLDDEDNENCTELCVGFNNMTKIKKFADILEKKGKLGDGFVKQMNNTILDATTAGQLGVRWGPYPCATAQIRLTSALLPHGSTARGTKLRRAIYPWYVGFPAGKGSAEVPEGPTFDELRVAHATGMAPPKTPSGYPYKYGEVSTPFPAFVRLEGVSAICDALVAQRPWDDGAVRLEMGDTFQGWEGRTYNVDDFDQGVRDYVNNCRHRILAKIAGTGNFVNEGLFDKVVTLEKMYYGEKSFFRRYHQFDTAQKIIALGADAVDTTYDRSHRPQSDMQDSYQTNEENAINELDLYELALNGKARPTRKAKHLDVFKNARENSVSPIRSGVTVRSRSSASSSTSSEESSSESSSSSSDEGDDDNPPQGSRGRSGSLQSARSHRSSPGSPYFPTVPSPGGSAGGMSPGRWLL